MKKLVTNSIINLFWKVAEIQKISSLGSQEPQPAGTGKWPMTLRCGKILGTMSIVRSIEDPQDVLKKIHRP